MAPPAHVLGLAAVARAFRAIASGGAPEVYRAMTSHPALVGGPGRDVTVLMEAIPGLVAKDGAEGVYAAAMPDGRAVAVKVADGAARARVPLLLAALCRRRRRRVGGATGHRARRRARPRPDGRRGPPDRAARRLVDRRLRTVASTSMTAIPFVPPLTEPRYGEPVRLSPLVRRVIAENPTKYSYVGTGTYILGDGDVAVIDPGPEIDSHRDALRAALAGQTVRAILVTHCHSDHSPLAAWLGEETGAPTVAFGPHGSGDHTYPVLPDDPADEEPDPDEPATTGEAIDTGFTPDVVARDGDRVDLVPGLTITAVHTPGHTANHLCFALGEERALFTGDHVMGWSTTVVSPPDGDMAAYIESMHRVIGRDDAVLYPTHGNPVDRSWSVPRCLPAAPAGSRGGGARPGAGRQLAT